MRPWAPDQILDSLAATQHGLAARHQLLSTGLSRHMIDDRVRSGRLVVMHRGVYRVCAHPETSPQRVFAAVLACGPGAVASHRAAGFLHGLAGIEPRPEVTVASGRGPTSGLVVHRTRRPPRATIVGNVPSTGVARTLIDLAGVVVPPALEEALDDALTRHLVTAGYLRRRLADLGARGRPGTALLAELLDERSGQKRPLNAFERRLFRLLRAAGVPLPIPQYEVRLPGGRKAYVDFAYPDLRIALEADSYRHHSSKSDWRRDHVRNRSLTALGWRIFPVTWDDLLRPESFLAELCTADPLLAGQRCAVR